MSRDTRKKASDVFRDTNYMFSKKVSFNEAFPEIEELKAVVVESGEGVRDWNRERYYSKGTGEYINCSNYLCYNGGFSIGNILREMVRTGETHTKKSQICQGYEGSPKGRRKYRDCMNFFTITIDITYKKTNKESDKEKS